MYNQSSGSMYEEIEKERAKKKRKRKILIRRIIAIILLVLIVIYLVILFIDTRRFKNGKYPLITTNIATKEYDDGTVKTYYSLGWAFRYYNRETIKDSELIPFYKEIKMDNVLKRDNDPNLPEIETDYDVPKNAMKQEKVANVLFFYDENDELLGTYACLESVNDCEISVSSLLGNDFYENKYKMGVIENRYVFITEYKNKNTEAEEKKIYLYDISAKSYIALYEDVRYSVLRNGKGYIDSSKYIIKKNGKWGIDQVIKGKVSNFLANDYDRITYDEDSKLYILEKNNNSYVFNSKDRHMTSELSIDINDLYLVDDKIYIISYDEDDYHKKIYKLYNQDGVNVLTKENIDNLVAYDKFLAYINDNLLYIINYDGEELIDEIKIYLSQSEETSKIKQYTINVKNDTLIIKVPRNSNTTHIVDEYYYDMNSWELTKKISPQETISY